MQVTNKHTSAGRSQMKETKTAIGYCKLIDALVVGGVVGGVVAQE